MKLENEFSIDAPADKVWAFFQDIPTLASCLPGAVYDGVDDNGKHKGTMSVKMGPINASFEGKSDVSYHFEERKMVAVGQGIDKKGASRGKMTLNCFIVDEGERTHVLAQSEIQISGTIAQFGRTGMMQEVAKVLISDFVKNAEAKLKTDIPEGGRNETVASAPSTPENASLSGVSLLLRVLKRWFTSVFTKRLT